MYVHKQLYIVYTIDSRIGRKPKLKDVPPANTPILVLIGCLILWYGWFAFNVTSPFAAGTLIGRYLGTAGLNTLIAPCIAAFAGMIYMNYTDSVSFEDLVACVLAGAVAITAGCYTVDWWAAVIIGFASSFLYFAAVWVVRKKLVIDDPLCVTPVHLFCGYFGCFAEGLFAVCYMLYFIFLYFIFLYFYIFYFFFENILASQTIKFSKNYTDRMAPWVRRGCSTEIGTISWCRARGMWLFFLFK